MSQVREPSSAGFSVGNAVKFFANDKRTIPRFQNLPIRRSAEELSLIASKACLFCALGALRGLALWLPYPGIRELIAFYADSSPFSWVME